MSEVFVKHNEAKSRVDLLWYDFILRMGHVLGFGAVKYSVANWKNCEDPAVYQAAALRHILEAYEADVRDPESGMHHLVHAAVNCMFALYIQERENGNL